MSAVTPRVTTILDHTTLNITSSSHLVNSHCDGYIKSAELLRQTNNCDPVICPTSRVQNVSIVCAASGSGVAKHRLDIRQTEGYRGDDVTKSERVEQAAGTGTAQHSTTRCYLSLSMSNPNEGYRQNVTCAKLFQNLGDTGHYSSLRCSDLLFLWE